MYAMSPARAAQAPATRSYRVARAAGATFSGPLQPLSPDSREFLSHQLAATGRSTRCLDQVSGTGYGRMVEQFVADLAAGTPVDLTVLAHEMPDFVLEQVAGITAAAATAGAPTMFTVTDAGPAAPFAALRLATLFADRQDLAHVVIVAVDQFRLPYHPLAAVSAQPAGADSAPATSLRRQDNVGVAAALLLHRTDDGTAERAASLPAVRTVWRAASPSRSTAEVLTSAYEEAVGAERPPSLAVLGPGCAGWVPPGPTDVRRVAVGRPAAALWAVVAAATAVPGRGAILVLDVDPGTGDVAGALL
ncbi:MAG: hypothetical protein L0H79_01565 [Intrasporangium sp.]|uniref:hypothetical protein n=1 Tax=Intrasporangium sp. TaxID=1925024 RepID=UPI00264724C2|nr:hypothetical protein [Intrasporangium sp.]MDN5794424.1 hypothetical protein [Intrasporangium sp.]